MTKYLIEVLAGWCIVSLAVELIYDVRVLFGGQRQFAPWPFRTTALGCTLAGLLYIIRVAFNIDQLRHVLTLTAVGFAAFGLGFLAYKIGARWGER